MAATSASGTNAVRSVCKEGFQSDPLVMTSWLQKNQDDDVMVTVEPFFDDVTATRAVCGYMYIILLVIRNFNL